jgi:hypothetical protein
LQIGFLRMTGRTLRSPKLKLKYTAHVDMSKRDSNEHQSSRELHFTAERSEAEALGLFQRLRVQLLGVKLRSAYGRFRQQLSYVLGAGAVEHKRRD